MHIMFWFICFQPHYLCYCGRICWSNGYREQSTQTVRELGVIGFPAAECYDNDGPNIPGIVQYCIMLHDGVFARWPHYELVCTPACGEGVSEGGEQKNPEDDFSLDMDNVNNCPLKYVLP